MSEPNVTFKVDTENLSLSILVGFIVLALFVGPTRSCDSRESFIATRDQCNHLCVETLDPKGCFTTCLKEYRFE